jgi:hypothetical protein
MMRRLQSIADQTLLPGEVVAVDPNVPRGCPRVAYDISGYDSVGNPLAPKKNGMRMRQTSLPIVFRSGLKAANADGVSVEAILAACFDHLESKQHTPDATPAEAKAASLIRKAMKTLLVNQPT